MKLWVGRSYTNKYVLKCNNNNKNNNNNNNYNYNDFFRSAIEIWKFKTLKFKIISVKLTLLHIKILV
jgi:hypothetical protein